MSIVLDTPTTPTAGQPTGPVTVTQHVIPRQSRFPNGYQSQVRFEFTAPGLPDPIVLAHHGELAMALHFSGDPLTGDPSLDQVAALIVRGVLAVGIDHVRAADVADRAANLDYADGAMTGRQWRTRPDRVWSPARGERCANLAYRLMWHLNQAEAGVGVAGGVA